MRKNVGKIDRVARLVVGLVIIVLGIVFGSWWGALGLIPIATAVVGWCPIYRAFRFSTRRRRRKPAQAQ